MNVQVLTDPFGKLIWASPALAGAVHDIRAARSHGLLDALNTGGIQCWAVLDRAARGWRGFTMTPVALRTLHDLRRALLEPPTQIRPATTTVTSVADAA